MTPKISILLASYGPQSQRYLDCCFRSLEAQTCQDFELIHVSSGDFIPRSRVDFVKGWKHLVLQDRHHFPAAIDKAYKMTNPNTEYIMLLNDDVILQKHCIHLMKLTLENLAGKNAILNPKSNCDDNGRFYMTLTPFTEIKYRIEQMEELVDKVIDFEHRQTFGVIRQHQVHFYCTLMTRKCWEEVGGIDPNFKTGFDDQDFCDRAKKKGYAPSIALHAYALHGSGVSADAFLSKEERDFNEQYYKEKHGFGTP